MTPMFDIWIILILALVLGYSTAGIVANLFGNVKACIIAGVATFALVTIELLFSLEILFYITIGVFVLALIFTLIKLKLHH